MLTSIANAEVTGISEVLYQLELDPTFEADLSNDPEAALRARSLHATLVSGEITVSLASVLSTVPTRGRVPALKSLAKMTADTRLRNSSFTSDPDAEPNKAIIALATAVAVGNFSLAANGNGIANASAKYNGAEIGVVVPEPRCTVQLVQEADFVASEEHSWLTSQGLSPERIKSLLRRACQHGDAILSEQGDSVAIRRYTYGGTAFDVSYTIHEDTLSIHAVRFCKDSSLALN